ncbi:sensor histidine kinase [Kaarinaea lacus]
MTSREFKNRFLLLILFAWTIPPIFGLSFLLFIKMFSGPQMLDILLSPVEPVFVIASLVLAVAYFSRYCRKICQHLDAPSAADGKDVLSHVKNFPLHFWSVFLIYLLIAPVTVIYSAETFSNFVARPVDWFRINLVALIVSIIVGLPIFFLLQDLFGKIANHLPITKPHITLKTKVFLIGALVPLLIDTMIVQYYWTRTGYFTEETFIVWLFLEILAILGSLIFVHSVSQSLQPLEQAIEEPLAYLEQNYSLMTPQSTDELGILTLKYQEMLQNLRKQHSQLETLVQERTKELAAANKELEAFSYSVSHDLRAPLRSISGFSQALLEDYPDKLDDTGKHYLNRLKAASNHMAQLIEDMMLLSRVNQAELDSCKLNLSQMAQNIVENALESAIDKHIEVEIEKNLSAYGDERLIQILLDNLINNALKYSSKADHPKIEIGFDKAKLAFYVRDNGVGFDMQYVDKIFIPFQRLHRPDDFEGSGIGLATASRIISRHQGKIWAYSEEGKGSTFYFTLSKESADTSGNNTLLKLVHPAN